MPFTTLFQSHVTRPTCLMQLLLVPYTTLFQSHEDTTYLSYSITTCAIYYIVPVPRGHDLLVLYNYYLCHILHCSSPTWTRTTSLMQLLLVPYTTLFQSHMDTNNLSYATTTCAIHHIVPVPRGHEQLVLCNYYLCHILQCSSPTWTRTTCLMQLLLVPYTTLFQSHVDTNNLSYAITTCAIYHIVPVPRGREQLVLCNYYLCHIPHCSSPTWTRTTCLMQLLLVPYTTLFQSQVDTNNLSYATTTCAIYYIVPVPHGHEQLVLCNYYLFHIPHCSSPTWTRTTCLMQLLLVPYTTLFQSHVDTNNLSYATITCAIYHIVPVPGGHEQLVLCNYYLCHILHCSSPTWTRTTCLMQLLLVPYTTLFQSHVDTNNLSYATTTCAIYHIVPVPRGHEQLVLCNYYLCHIPHCSSPRWTRTTCLMKLLLVPYTTLFQSHMDTNNLSYATTTCAIYYIVPVPRGHDLLVLFNYYLCHILHCSSPTRTRPTCLIQLLLVPYTTLFQSHVDTNNFSYATTTCAIYYIVPVPRGHEQLVLCNYYLCHILHCSSPTWTRTTCLMQLLLVPYTTLFQSHEDANNLSYATTTCAIYHIVPVPRGHEQLVLCNYYLCHIPYCSSPRWTRTTCLMQLLLVPYTTLFQSHMDTNNLSYATITCSIYHIVPVPRGHEQLVLCNYYLCHIPHCSSPTWTRTTCLMQLLLVPYTTLFQSQVDTNNLSYATTTCAIYYIVPVPHGHEQLVLCNYYLCHIPHCSSPTWTRTTCLMQLLLVPYTTLFQSHVDTNNLSYATITCAIYHIVPVPGGHEQLVLCNYYLCHILHCSSPTWTRTTCLMQLLLVPYTTLFQSHEDTTYLSYTTTTCAIYYIVPVPRGHEQLVLCNYYLCHTPHCSSPTWTRTTCLMQLLLVPYTTMFQSHMDTNNLSYATTTCAIHHIVPVPRGHEQLVLCNYYLCHILQCSSPTWTRTTCLMQLLLVPYTTLFQSHVDTNNLSYAITTCAIYHIVPVPRGREQLVLCNYYLCHIPHCSSPTWTRTTCLMQLLLVPYTTLFQSQMDTNNLSYATITCAIYHIVPVPHGHEQLVLCNYYLCHIPHCSSPTWTRTTCLMQLLLVPYTTLFQSHVDTNNLSYATITCAIYYIVPVPRGHEQLVLCNYYLCHIPHCSSPTWTRTTCLMQLLLVPYTTLFQSHVDTNNLSYATITCAIYHIVPVPRGHEQLVLCNYYLCHIPHCSSPTWTRTTCLMQLLLVPYTTLFQSHVDTNNLSYVTTTCAIYHIVPVPRGHEQLVLCNYYLCHILQCSSLTGTRTTCLMQLLLVPYTTLFQSHVDTNNLSYATTTCAIYYIVPVPRGHDLLVLCNCYVCLLQHCSSHT